MKSILTLIVFSFLSIQLNAQIDPETIQLPDALDRVLRDYETHWQNSDAQKLADLFTEDAYILRPNKPIVSGQANIQKVYQTAGGNLILEAYDFSIDGNTGFIIGGYKGNENWPARGKFILALKKVNDIWMIHADMDNSNITN